MNFDRRNNGAGLIVILDDGGPAVDIHLVDGNDLAFINFTPPLDTTTPQTFTFEPAPVDRVIAFSMFASSVVEADDRPNVIEVTVDGVTTPVSRPARLHRRTRVGHDRTERRRTCRHRPDHGPSTLGR